MTTGRPYLRGLRLAAVGLLANAALALVKLLAGLLGHSYALVADAVESLADIFASLVVWSGLRVAALPPDSDHPYGHGKAEPLAALVVAMIISGAGLAIAAQAVREIVTPHHAPAAFTLWVLVIVVAAKELLFRVVRRAAGVEGSTAILADAWHHRSDALTSAAAGIGIAVALVGGPGYESADDWAALAASAVIVTNAYRLARGPVAELMDARPADITDRVREVVRGVPEVAGVEKVLARKSGVEYWVDLHIEVDADMTVGAAHAVAHRVKDHVREVMPNVRDVLVHVEPAGQLAGGGFRPDDRRHD